MYATAHGCAAHTLTSFHRSPLVAPQSCFPGTAAATGAAAFSGKTSLCKALAGRLPTRRVWGDVNVLVSTTTDAVTASGAGAAADSSAHKIPAAAAAASDSAVVPAGAAGSAGYSTALLPAAAVAHITGFVPQFDLLHDSLTVRWSLPGQHF